MGVKQDELVVRAGLEWLAEHTTIPVDVEKPESLIELPARAQLFVRKYGELMRRSTGVTSQSMEGMSQSFAAGNDESAIWALAKALLHGDIKSQARVFQAKRRW